MPILPDIAESPVRVACLQVQPVIGDKAASLAAGLALLDQAAGQGATLAVLPELCNTGYVFASRAEAFALAETVADGPSIAAWTAAARRHGLHIVAGFAERDGDRLYNAAVLIGPDGVIGRYRKLHLWGAENLFFEPGDLGVPVWPTAFGRVALAICYDIWFPEVFRLAALQGADLLCVPTNWVPMADQPADAPVMANILAMAGAHANSLAVAAADRVGVERGQPFIGRSVIVNHAGWPVAGPASADQPELLLADLNLADARRRRNWNDFNQVLRDRRIDLYDRMLGSGLRPGWY